jgi:hypothetical protein
MSYGERFDMVFADRLPSPDLLSLTHAYGKMVVFEPVVRCSHSCLVEQNDLFDIYKTLQTHNE